MMGTASPPPLNSVRPRILHANAGDAIRRAMRTGSRADIAWAGGMFGTTKTARAAWLGTEAGRQELRRQHCPCPVGIRRQAHFWPHIAHAGDAGSASKGLPMRPRQRASQRPAAIDRLDI